MGIFQLRSVGFGVPPHRGKRGNGGGSGQCWTMIGTCLLQLNSCLAQASRMVQSRPSSHLLRTLPTRFGTLIDVVVWQCSSREREEKGKAGNNSLACFGFIFPILSLGCWLLHTTIGALATNQERISTLYILAKQSKQPELSFSFSPSSHQFSSSFSQDEMRYTSLARMVPVSEYRFHFYHPYPLWD